MILLFTVNNPLYKYATFSQEQFVMTTGMLLYIFTMRPVVKCTIQLLTLLMVKSV